MIFDAAEALKYTAPDSFEQSAGWPFAKKAGWRDFLPIRWELVELEHSRLEGLVHSCVAGPARFSNVCVKMSALAFLRFASGTLHQPVYVLIICRWDVQIIKFSYRRSRP